MAKNKVLLALSGGVDSSLAGLLLQRQGYALAAVTMLTASETPPAGAAEAAAQLGIPHQFIDLRQLFREKVIVPFCREYRCGRTPNPCVNCNRWLKFGLLPKLAEEMGCDHFATGHYARVDRMENGRYFLRRGLDTEKDQTYFLYPLAQTLLSRLLLPLGEMTKTETRRLAAEAGLSAAERADSQDICFIPDGDYRKFLQKMEDAPLPPGDFVDRQGKRLGRHSGLDHYTVGQRKGLGIALGHPVYVTALDAEKNRVILGTKEDLLHEGLLAKDCVFQARESWTGELPVLAKCRYRAAAVPAFIRREGDYVRLRFAEPESSATAGQAVVFYEGDRLLGGGTIDKVF